MARALIVRGALVSALALSILACAPSSERADAQPEAVSPGTRPAEKPAASPETRPAEVKEAESAAKPVPEKQDYVVVSEASDMRIFVYRTGRLADKLGHNHVVSSEDIQGTMMVTRDLVGSTVDIRIPVATLVVDDPQKRKEAGEGFQTQVPEKDIKAARQRMLSSQVLDAGPYPLVKIKATVTGGTPPEMQADVAMTLHGQVRNFLTLVRFERQEALATATGSFTLLQTDFGIEPFSMLGGALAVRDEVGIQYRIVAKPKD